MSSVLSQKILQDDIVEHRVGQQALELSVLIFQRLQPGGFGDLHAAILGFQLVERRRAETMPAAHLRGRHPGLLLLDHPDYLRLGETALPHSSAPSRLSRIYIRLRDLAGGRSCGMTTWAPRSAMASWHLRVS